MKVRPEIVVIAIVCITVLEITALAVGMNGLMFKTTVGGIFLLAGVAIPTPKLMGKE